MGKLGAPKIIVVKLQGGLGNQLFQYAAARGITPGHQLLFDRSYLELHDMTTATDTARAFELSVFTNLRGRTSPLLIFILKSKNRFVGILKRVLFGNMLQVPETPYRSLPGCLASHASVYLDGYFQDELFFRHLRESLLQELVFPDPGEFSANWLTKIVSAGNAVSVHVRRGDYLSPKALKYHGVLGTDYYQRAAAEIDSKVPGAHYFIFSDDPHWCREHFNFLENKSIVVTGQKDWIDMALMSKCRHHIIANSSFSWWAAWLNDHPGKIVVAPRQWFADPVANAYRVSIIPDNWISL